MKKTVLYLEYWPGFGWTASSQRNAETVTETVIVDAALAEAYFAAKAAFDAKRAELVEHIEPYGDDVE